MTDCPNNDSPVIRDVIAARASRRTFLQGVATLGALAAGQGFVGSLFANETFAATATSSLGFTELKRVYDKDMAVAPGYGAKVVAKWGDPMAKDVAEFSGEVPSAAEQLVRFGYNCDYIAFMPLPKGAKGSDHGLLCVNNEYISPNVIFPGMTEDDAGQKMTREQVDFGMAAMGHSIVEVNFRDGGWVVVKDSPYNRRLTVETPMALSGTGQGS